jgi:hypothetical protein
MNNLFTYVSAIHHLSSAVSIVREEVKTENWLDQNFEVTKTVAIYWFDNGVIISQTVEKDSFPSDLACAESWIIYEVLAEDNLPSRITPSRQVFENTCRESFWLTYQRQPL